VISGYPSSGKTHRSQQLLAFFTRKISDSIAPAEADSDGDHQQQGQQGQQDQQDKQQQQQQRRKRLKVHHIDDLSLGLSRNVYASARTEKDARATFSSAVKRLLSRDAIVIADGMNYIKGFRYQLYCEAKAVQTPSCTIHVGTPQDKCRDLNQTALVSRAGGYDPDVFDNLLYRYEEPNGMNRWDAPLFTVPFDDPEPPYEAIWEAIVGSNGKVKVVRPNAATVLKPASEQNYLYELDRTTSDVIAAITNWQKDHQGEGGGIISVSDAERPITLPAAPPSLPFLQRQRRQFIALNRQHTLSKARIRDLFVDYLNDAFQN
jgi:protein KTI12